MPSHLDLLKMGWVIDEVPTPKKSPRQQMTTPVLRRSSRKRSMPPAFSSVFTSPPPSAKKSRKDAKVPSPPVAPPTLLTLPHCAISRLLLCLDVDSLERLSATCSYFDQMIAGKFLLSISFPFPVSFIKEVMDDDSFEKKPLLKLSGKKTRDEFKTIPDITEDYSEPSSLHKLIIGNSPEMMDYLVFSQMSLLSLHKLRELDLVPESVKQEGRLLGQRIMDSYSSFDCSLLRHISRLGSLKCLTRLDMLVDQNLYLEQFMAELPNLLELGLTILTRPGLSKHVYLHEYIPRLEAVVTATKAPVLKVTVVAETRRQVNKIFKNSHVEKLVLTGPCTFNIFPVMERLKEVVVNLETSLLDNNCTYWKSRIDDRGLHRAGLCCVNIGAVYENCPNLERFMGVEVGMVSHKQTFNKWNIRMKKRFYDDYLQQGGSKEMKAWAKTRWFSRRPVLPMNIGYDRVFN
eukprot:GFUD01009644.1.p1 GENE.GFUD01009644.1~~GFUD01009644.1.p1  ORF type:complete len:460 (+),score=96.16 GFUD01009644.1:81-1460(+)